MGTTPAPGLLPAKADLETLFGELGHRRGDLRGLRRRRRRLGRGRFIWLLDVIGHHRSTISTAACRPGSPTPRCSTEGPGACRRPLPLTLHDRPSSTREYLQSRLGAADLAVWDARNPNKNTPVPGARREGRACARRDHSEWTASVDPARALRIRADIAEILEALGITPDKEVITHARPTITPTSFYLVAKALELPAGQRLRRLLVGMGQPPRYPCRSLRDVV